MIGKRFDECEPCFAISVVAKAVNMHPQTIRHYENLGFVKPHRTGGKVRLYSKKDIEMLERINSYTSMGVNLAGVEIILRLLGQIDDMEREMESQMEKMEKDLEEFRKNF